MTKQDQISMFGMTIEEVKEEPIFKTNDIFGDIERL